MTELLTIEDLPAGFSYPDPFVRIVGLGLTDLEPWWVLGGDALRQAYLGLKERYPSRSVVPFAARQDSDDIACWDTTTNGRVVVIHDFASPGDELDSEFADFTAWFRQAIDDLLEWE